MSWRSRGGETVRGVQRVGQPIADVVKLGGPAVCLSGKLKDADDEQVGLWLASWHRGKHDLLMPFHALLREPEKQCAPPPPM